MELPLKELASILLALRVGSDIFIFNVLRKQYRLLKVELPDSVRRFRRRLFALSIVLFMANLYPITLDILAIFGENVGRSATVKLPGALYAISNAGFALVTGLLVWSLYKLAANENENTDFMKVSLQERKDVGLSRENSKTNR